jgi:uncharacterized membrane protein
MKGGGSGSGFLRLSALLGLAASGCLLLFGLRVAISGTTYYRYLVWNLVLAIAPYAIAALGVRLLSREPLGKGRAATLLAWAVALLWIVFYPNSPYIFTDFIHVINRTYLRARPAEWLGLNALLWYDLLMNAAFAFIGHFIGLVSMWLIRASYAELWGDKAARALVAAAILLSGFGIYLGRFSRLNTWDIFFNPSKVLGEAAEATADIKAILFSAAFSLFIFFTYAALSLFKRIETPPMRGRKD